MTKIPASAGWAWIKDGFGLFRKQPVELSMLFLMYILLILVMLRIPVVGLVFFMVLSPVFSMTFMQAGADIEQGKRVLPNLLFVGFRSPALRSLVILGVISSLATVGAVAASALIDGGMFLDTILGKIKPDEKMMEESNMSLAVLFSTAVYIPAAMAFWYAAPLMVWQNMKTGKALFYSFFAVCKAAKAFVVYLLIWSAIGMILLLGTSSGAAMVFAPLGVVLMLVRFCSFYPTYATLFGSVAVDEVAPVDELPPPDANE